MSPVPKRDFWKVVAWVPDSFQLTEWKETIPACFEDASCGLQAPPCSSTTS